jgi:hypothetical protein
MAGLGQGARLQGLPVTIFAVRPQKILVMGGRRTYMQVTQFARACGRVSIGGHPDKRPDSRPKLGDRTEGDGYLLESHSRFTCEPCFEL